jgi:2-methylcitrate dehydratase PrpD
MFTLLSQEQFGADDVERVTVDGPPMLKDPLIYTHPGIGLHGKFSLHYNIALALVDGKAGLRSYTDEHIRDPRLSAVIDKVQVNTHDDWQTTGDWQPNWGARVSIQLKDGREFVQDQTFIKGDPQHPLTWDEILAKYRDNASVLLGPDAVERSISLIEGLEGVPSIRTLVNELAAIREPALT